MYESCSISMIKRRKLSYFGQIMRKAGNCLDKTSCRTQYTGSEKARENQGCDVLTTWKNGLERLLTNY